MKKLLTHLFCGISLYVAHTTVYAQNNLATFNKMQSPVKTYAVARASSALHIDGKADEAAWQAAPWTASFIDIEGLSKAKPSYDTKVKMLWDDEYLYIYALLEEPHIWGDITQHDAIIYHNNDFEVFIKPYASQPFYYEIEVNALNTVMDLMMNKPYRLGGEAMMHWDVKGLKTAVHTAGTLNEPTDSDKYWAVEMAIPFTSISTFGRKTTPKRNDHWRVNFSRVQWEHDIIDGKYSRKRKANKLLDEANWVWSPIGLINMHYPERWGYIQFVEKATDPIAYPTTHAIEQAAWNISYLQNIYKKQKGVYATSLENLQKHFPKQPIEAVSFSNQLITNKDKTFYKLILSDKQHDITLAIDSFGNYNLHTE